MPGWPPGAVPTERYPGAEAVTRNGGAGWCRALPVTTTRPASVSIVTLVAHARRPWSSVTGVTVASGGSPGTEETRSRESVSHGMTLMTAPAARTRQPARSASVAGERLGIVPRQRRGDRVQLDQRTGPENEPGGDRRSPPREHPDRRRDGDRPQRDPRVEVTPGDERIRRSAGQRPVGDEVQERDQRERGDDQEGRDR